jgi:hypothetical protein
LKKKVRGGSELLGADMEKPYAPKCVQEKTKINLFRDFLQKPPNVQVMNFIPVKVSTLYISGVPKRTDTKEGASFRLIMYMKKFLFFAFGLSLTRKSFWKLLLNYL